MRMQPVAIGAAALGLSLLAIAPARGDFVTIPQPDPAYQSSTTKIPITVADNTTLAMLSDATLSVGFSSQMKALTVPTTWFSWSSPPFAEDATPRVLYTQAVNTETLTFSQPLTTFGVEMEPNLLTTSAVNMTATFMDGATTVGTITRGVQGFQGARLFAASTTTQVFTSVVLTAPVPAQGFAIAEVRYVASVPEPDSLTLGLIAALALAAFAASRRR